MQSRKMSAIETIVNVTVGFLLSWGVTLWIVPLWGIEYSAEQAFEITLMMFFISTTRLYAFRRVFARLERR